MQRKKTNETLPTLSWFPCSRSARLRTYSKPGKLADAEATRRLEGDYILMSWYITGTEI